MTNTEFARPTPKLDRHPEEVERMKKPAQGVQDVCACCGQVDGICPSCGRHHSPAVGVGRCEECAP